jgi:glycosyltransferase involved in cell wall biosynthesis
MRVAIALTSSSRYISGVQRHAVNLARCLLTRDEITMVHLIAAPWQEAAIRDALQLDDARLRLHISPLANNALSRNLWYYAQLPRIAAEIGADLVHYAFPMPVRRHTYPCPVVITLHDLYPYDAPANFGFPKVLFNKLVLEQCLHSADVVACISSSTLNRLQSIHPRFPLQKALVINNCVEVEERVSSRSPLPGWRCEPFLLCVAQHRRNKNLLLLLRVFEALCAAMPYCPQLRLVIVGMAGPQTGALRRFLRHHPHIKSRVLLLQGLREEELQWCYRHCALLVAPSTVEGFGLPIAEGLLAGCRVICSDIPAFREVGGNHCEYIQLGRNEEIAFKNAIQAKLFRGRPSAMPLPQLSRTHIGAQYLQLYRSLLRPDASPDSMLLHTSLPTSGGSAIQ